ncbi:MAG TPA: aspartate-semialdehyde dehydrogenase [Candidatus Bathyarchaeia archaeon]|nr:aspartate-semialdehyde dehydrogenase [Candidatus Bathyarchaeia archaeon]
MKRKVAVLGATGMMGQKFVQLLAHHPWFEVSAVAASDKSVGKEYGASIGSRKEANLPDELGELVLTEPKPQALDDPDVAFSALPAEVAGPIEEDFAKAGMPVFSNASSHRMDQYVPLLNPEVNPEHAEMVEEQKRRMKTDGFIVANPNCTTAILTLSLKPLQDKFGLETVVVSSMQAVSGAGYPGVASLDIMQNVIPFIRNEEEKVEHETNKILGTVSRLAGITVSASCNRVPTIHGHMEAVFSKTRSAATPNEVIKVMSEFKGAPQQLKLPSAPEYPIIVREEEDRPQTRLDVDEGNGMTVTVGRVRRDPALNGVKYMALGHNLVRGGAGCSILNAELLLAKKLIK